MGNNIEGPTRVVGYYYDDLSPYRQARRQSYGSREPGWSDLWKIVFSLSLLAVGLIGGALFTLLFWSASEDKKYAEMIEGRCYETAAGARGVVESVWNSGKRVELSFSSGVSSTYALAKLREIPCSQVSDSEETMRLLD